MKELYCLQSRAPILCNLFVVSLADGNGLCVSKYVLTYVRTYLLSKRTNYRLLHNHCTLLIYSSFPCRNVYISIAFVLAPYPSSLMARENLVSVACCMVITTGERLAFSDRPINHNIDYRSMYNNL